MTPRRHVSLRRRRHVATQCVAVALIAALLAASGSGCAVANRKNTRLVNAVEQNLLPAEGNAWRPVAFIALLPVGLVAVVIDGVIIHPISVLDDAWRDVRELIWKRFNWETEYVTEVTIYPFRVIFSPVWFGAAWIVRSVFDILPADGSGADAGERPDAHAPPSPELVRLRELRAAGDHAAVFAYFKTIPQDRWYSMPDLVAEALTSARDANDPHAVSYVLMTGVWVLRESDGRTLIPSLLLSKNAAIRLIAMPFVPREHLLVGDGLALASDPDPVVRFFWIDLMRGSVPLLKAHPDALAALRTMAQSDAVETVRVKAAEMLREVTSPGE